MPARAKISAPTKSLVASARSLAFPSAETLALDELVPGEGSALAPPSPPAEARASIRRAPRAAPAPAPEELSAEASWAGN